MKTLMVILCMLLMGCASTDDRVAEVTEIHYTIDDINYKAIDYHAKRIAYHLAQQVHVMNVPGLTMGEFTLVNHNNLRFQRGFNAAFKRALRMEGFSLQTTFMDTHQSDLTAVVHKSSRNIITQNSLKDNVTIMDTQDKSSRTNQQNYHLIIDGVERYQIEGEIYLLDDRVLVNTQLFSEDTASVYASYSQSIPFKPIQRKGYSFQRHRSYIKGPIGTDEEI